MLCGATLFGAKRAHFAGVPTHSPPGNAGDASRHTRSKAPFPAPSVVHLPGRLLPGFHSSPALKARVLFISHVTV